MSKFILYNYFRSSTSYRTRIALHLKDIPFEYKAVHLLEGGGQQHSEDYKKLNPQQEVPTLVHDGKVISQSMAIAEYLEEVHPAIPLFPNNPFIKSKVRQFCENINSFIHPMSNLKLMQRLENKYQFSADQKTEWIHHWSGIGFEALEKMLSEYSGSYCFGDEVTLADTFLVPSIFTANRFKVDLKNFPLCLKVNDYALKLEAFKKSHPGRQLDTPAADKIN